MRDSLRMSVLAMIDRYANCPRQRSEELLEKRIKKLEQYHCEHEFSDPPKGCLDSLFCRKCGTLNPEWEVVPAGAMCFSEREYLVGPGLVGPAKEPLHKDECVCVKDVWYQPVERPGKQYECSEKKNNRSGKENK